MRLGELVVGDKHFYTVKNGKFILNIIKMLPKYLLTNIVDARHYKNFVTGSRRLLDPMPVFI